MHETWTTELGRFHMRHEAEEDHGMLLFSQQHN